MVSVLPASTLSRRVSASSEQIEEGGIPVKRFIYYGSFADCGTSEAYVRKAWKVFVDTGKDLTDLPTMDEQDALKAEEDEVVAANPAPAAVPTVINEALLDVNKDGYWYLEDAVGLDKVERAGRNASCASCRKNVGLSGEKFRRLPLRHLRWLTGYSVASMYTWLRRSAQSV